MSDNSEKRSRESKNPEQPLQAEKASQGGEVNQLSALETENNLSREALEGLWRLLNNARQVPTDQTGKATEVAGKIYAALAARPPVSVVFPPSAEVLLSLINTLSPSPLAKDDDVTAFFKEYFVFEHHKVIDSQSALSEELDADLMRCTSHDNHQTKWPSPWSLPAPCVTLTGLRSFYVPQAQMPQRIRRLFVADLVWLFYFEKMGVLKALMAILDDFATKGEFTISNGSKDTDRIKDDIAAIILEAMIRHTKMGLSSTVRDRDSSYRRCLGWTSEVGRKLGSEAMINGNFNTSFHRFIRNALEFYRDRRLAEAIRATVTPNTTASGVTLTTIIDSVKDLKNAFERFNYGRNYTNTLTGIVWTIAGLAIIRELRTTLGIPPEYQRPEDYIPAAYDRLVMKRPITSSNASHYTLHKECATNARDVLLGVEVLDHSNEGDLETWLKLIESKVEGYRTAYLGITGTDLGMPAAPGAPIIEQAV
jgi:hypothetical protein